jgi:phosphoserine phosphatase RsbU/P
VMMAAEVQQRMTPSSPPKAAGLDVSAIFVPCFELGGDFFDFIELPNQNWGIAVADVVGKGVRASLLMAASRAALRAYAKHWYNLSDVLTALNVHMCRESDSSDFITMFYGILDATNRRLTYCSAGHEPPLLVRDGRIMALEGSYGGVLGVDEKASFRHAVVDLRTDDVLAIYTDGLLEAMNFRDEIFGRERTQQTILTACRQNPTADAIGKQVLWEVRRFTGLQTRSDDLTLLVIKVQ